MKLLNLFNNFILIVVNLSTFTMVVSISIESMKHFNEILLTLLEPQHKHESLCKTTGQIIQSSESLLKHGTLAMFLINSSLQPTTNPLLNKLSDINCYIPVIFLKEKFTSSQESSFRHKHTSPSNIFLTDWSYENINSVRSLIIKKFIKMLALHDNNEGSIHRNKDFFLFLAKDIDACEQILFSEIKTLVKFKVCLYENKVAQHQEKIEKVTISPFFPGKGSNQRGKIINLPLHNRYIVNLLQDFTWNYYGYKLQMAISHLYKPVYEVEVGSFGKVVPKRGFFKDFTENIFTKLNFTTNKFLFRFWKVCRWLVNRHTFRKRYMGGMFR